MFNEPIVKDTVLDILLGGGIYPSAVYEIFGTESTGKSAVAMYLGVKAQQNNVRYIHIESEYVFDEDKFQRQGGTFDEEKFTLFKTNILEEGFKFIFSELEKAYLKKQPCLIVWDTIGFCLTENQFKTKSNFSGGIAEESRVISRAMKYLVPLLSKSNSAIIFANQIYETMVGGYKSKGGRAIKYASLVRMKVNTLKRIEKVSLGVKQIYGIISEVEAVKNKVVPAIKFPVFIKEGIVDEMETYLYVIKELFGVKGSAGWYQFKFEDFDVEFKVRNAEDLQKYLDKHKNLLDIIKYKVYEYYCNVNELFKKKLNSRLQELKEKLFA